MANLLVLLIFAQAGGQKAGGAQQAGALATAGLMCACYGFMFLLIGLPTILGMWKVFVKAGEPGWASIVPVYNMMVMARIGGQPEINGLLAALIPCVGLYFLIMIYIDVAKAFAKDAGFAVGMLLLAPVFFPILGFGSARYRLGRRRDGDEEEDDRPRRRRRDEEDEDEEEDDRPRRRPRAAEDEEGRPRRRPRPAEDDDEDRPRPKRRPRDEDDE